MHGTANLLNFAYISLQVGETNDDIDWKEFTEGENTWEPLTNQAEDNPALVKEYLMKNSAEEAEPIKSALKDLSVFSPKEVFEILLDV
jgi:hypothetical protein